MKYILTLSFLLTALNISANASTWQPLGQPIETHTVSSNSSAFKLDRQTLEQALNTGNSQARARSNLPNNIIDIPLPDGSLTQVIATPSETMQSSLAERYPSIKTWNVQGISNPNITGVIDLTPSGFHAMLYMPNGHIVFVDPQSTTTDDQNITTYISRYKNKSVTPLQCATVSTDDDTSTFDPLHSARSKVADSIIKYRIAIAATGEYTHFHGGTVTSALSAITTTLNRINALFKRDLGITFVLVDNNDDIIYTSSRNDPYTPFFASFMIDQNISTLNSRIGHDNYDIGHVFSQGQDNGRALAESVCSTEKAGGYTSSVSPVSDTFDIDFVAHEIGHQMGADHSFNSTTGSCGGGTRAAAEAFEPGSGSSIMAYAGLCDGNNIQNNSDPVFHMGSIAIIKNFTRSNSGKNCGSRASNTNNNPEIQTTTPETSIPVQTAFTLTTTASDPDNDNLTYTWDQVDTGRSSSATIDTGDNPIFRSNIPSSSNTREFPSITAQQSSSAIAGELFPIGKRDLNFLTAVRDNKGGLESQAILIHTIDSEPGKKFAITSSSSFTSNSDTTITWNVANTHLPPINCSGITLSLSTDKGLTYPHVLVSNTPNDGSETVKLPNVAMNTNIRYKLACTDSIFFSVTKNSTPTATDSNAISNNISSYAQQSTNSSNSLNNLSSGDDEDDGGSTWSLSMIYYSLLLLIFIGFRRKLRA